VAAPTVQVLVGFNVIPGSGPLFRLDDPVYGLLDSTDVLGGAGAMPPWTDVSAHVSGQIATGRGRSREADQFTTGTCSFTLRNESRLFDPTNTASMYYPGVVPRTPVQILVAGVPVFTGIVDDYDVSYQKPNICTVAVTCLDTFSILANTYVVNQSLVQQQSGARILDLLALNGYAAPTSIAAGLATIQAGTYGTSFPGDVVLTDMQNISASEWGFLFVDANGVIQFHDRYWITESEQAYGFATTFSDVAADIAAGAFGYFDVGMVSATRLLYNQVLGTRNGGAQMAANNYTSQIRYQLRSLTLPAVENVNDTAVLALCNWVLSIYQNPVVRFDTLEIEMAGLSPTQQASLAALDLMSLAWVKRTPPGGGTPAVIAIPSYVESINYALDASGSTYRVKFGFGTVPAFGFVLDSATLGVLDVNQLPI
jgi:hypothetical protein